MKKLFISEKHWERGGIGRRTALKMRRGNPCRFKSDHLYELTAMIRPIAWARRSSIREKQVKRTVMATSIRGQLDQGWSASIGERRPLVNSRAKWQKHPQKPLA